MSLDISGLKPTNSSILSVLDGPVCPSLRSAVSALVSRKQILDDLYGEVMDRWLVPDFLPAQYGSSLDSVGFLSVVLPFLDLTPREHELPARIPTDLILGESWRWKQNHIKPDERDRLLASLCHDDRAFRVEKDTATALWIRPLNLFVAHEGKSRAHFLRSMGEATMPAAVTPVDYPAANRLTMYCVQVAGRELVWLVLDDQYLQELRYPALSVPFFRAYGVCTNAQWPSCWPDPMEVLEEMGRMPARMVRSQPISLSALRQRHAEEAQVCVVSLSNIAVSQLRVMPTILALAAWVGLSIGSSLWADSSWQSALGTALALIAGVYALYKTPLFRVARRHGLPASRTSGHEEQLQQ